MKQEIITAKRPKLILQVFHNYFQYHKELKSFEDRKEDTAWKKEILSKSAYLRDGKLVMAKADYSAQLLTSDLIILNDFNADSELEAMKRQNKRWRKDLLEFTEKQTDSYRQP